MTERLHGRVPVRVKVQFRNASSFLIAYSLNLSRGGIFVETTNPPEVGSLLELEFDAPQAREIVLRGRVTWRRAVGDADGPVGVGIEFDDVTDSLGEIIDRLVAEFAGVNLLLYCHDARERETLRRMLRSVFAAAEVVAAESAAVCGQVLEDSIDLLVAEADDDVDGALRVIGLASGLASPVPVVVLTSDDELAERLRQAGAIDRVGNPPSLAELSRAVVRALGRATTVGGFQD